MHLLWRWAITQSGLGGGGRGKREGRGRGGKGGWNKQILSNILTVNQWSSLSTLVWRLSHTERGEAGGRLARRDCNCCNCKGREPLAAAGQCLASPVGRRYSFHALSTVLTAGFCSAADSAAFSSDMAATAGTGVCRQSAAILWTRNIMYVVCGTVSPAIISIRPPASPSLYFLILNKAARPCAWCFKHGSFAGTHSNHVLGVNEECFM